VSLGYRSLVVEGEVPEGDAALPDLQHRARRSFGADRGAFEVPEDFDDPLPDEVRRTFDVGWGTSATAG